MSEWYGEDMYAQCLKRQMDKRGTDWLRKPESFDFKAVPYEDLQDMATVVSAIRHRGGIIEHTSGVTISYEHKQKLTEALNAVAYERLGEYAVVFKSYYDKCEQWLGDEIFSLMVLNNYMGYDCFQILKRIVALKHLITLIQQGKGTDVEYMQLMHRFNFGTNFIDGTVGEEPKLHVTDVSFEEKNKDREKAIKQKAEFVKAVLEEHDFEKAYVLLGIKE